MRIERIARDHDIAVLGPNCLGMHNFVAGVPLELIGVHGPDPAAGPPVVAVASQSGGLGNMLSRALRAQHGIEPTLLAFTGNEAVVSVEDVLMDVVEDDVTKVVALGAEGLRKPQLFLRGAARARERGKPIVLLHPGASERAQRAALSHTGALAGDHAVMRTLAEAEAVIVVESFDEWVAVTGLLCAYPTPPQVPGIGVITSSGGFRGLALDLGQRLGVELPELAEPTLSALADLFGDFGVPDNPLDLTTRAAVELDLYGRAAALLNSDPKIGSALFASLGDPAINLEFARLALPYLRECRAPVVYSMFNDSHLLGADFLQFFRDEGIPYVRSRETALAAMGRAADYGRFLQRAAARRATAGHPAKLPASGPLTETESKAILGAAGIPVPVGRLCEGLATAHDVARQLGYPVALKAQARALIHKSDAGGVILNIFDEATLTRAWKELHGNIARSASDLELDAVLLEVMGDPGTEFIVGAKRHPAWGPVLMIGLGGIWAEALQDVRLMPVDLDAASIEAELQMLRAASLFEGLRGSPPLDVRALVDVASRIGDLMQSTPEIMEIDVNPLVVNGAGSGALALDAVIVTEQAGTP